MECYYCKKRGHTAWNCRFWANDILKGKVKEKSHSTNAAITVKPSEDESGDDLIEGRAFYAF